MAALEWVNVLRLVPAGAPANFSAILSRSRFEPKMDGANAGFVTLEPVFAFFAVLGRL
jgi:hypothetical protein